MLKGPREVKGPRDHKITNLWCGYSCYALFDLSWTLKSGVIDAARLRQLRSGHSHEDVDQVFGRLAAYVARHARTAIGPPEFCRHIQTWLDEKLDRPHEEFRECIQMDQCRDWMLVVMITANDKFVYYKALTARFPIVGTVCFVDRTQNTKGVTTVLVTPFTFSGILDEDVRSQFSI